MLCLLETQLSFHILQKYGLTMSFPTDTSGPSTGLGIQPVVKWTEQYSSSNDASGNHCFSDHTFLDMGLFKSLSAINIMSTHY